MHLAEHTTTNFKQTYALTGSSPMVDREQLILDHVSLVKYHAFRIAGGLPPSVDMNDLVNAGVIGLIDAVSKFDAERGVKFKTYAEVRIRGAILDSLRELDWAPQSLRRKGKQLKDAQDKLHTLLGREASMQELCEEMGIGIDEFHALSEQLNGATLGSFREVMDEDGESRIDYYPDSITNGPHFQFQKQELKQLLASAVDDLNPKERLVVSLYYFEELTMKEIGAVLDVNESRVSQIHSKAITHLRDKIRDLG